MDPEVTSRGLGSLGWNTVVGLCGCSSELVLRGPAAGVLGCWSAGGQLCGHWRRVKKKRSATSRVGTLKTATFQANIVSPHQ